MAAKKAAPKAEKAPEKAEKVEKAKVKPMSKSELYGKLAEKTGLTKKQVDEVFDAVNDLIKTSLTKKGGPEQFVLPGLLKLKVVKKPATKAKEGRNPFTGEPMTIKAKPARKAVKAYLMKSLKEII
jgi:nucleoid DNA-binding protein